MAHQEVCWGRGVAEGAAAARTAAPAPASSARFTRAPAGSTTISGTVYDPAGNDPLYDVVVYVPNTTPDPLTPGIDATSCSCDALYTGQPIAAAVTDATGKFTINNAPDGTTSRSSFRSASGASSSSSSRPSTRARRTRQPDEVAHACRRTRRRGTSRASRSRRGAQTRSSVCSCASAWIPRSTAAGPRGTGRIHIFQGGNDPTDTPNTNPPGPASNANLWDSAGDINKYDIVLLSCEGSETYKPSAQTVYNYVNGGGRLFAEHYHYVFFGPTLTEPSPGSPPFPTDLATWTPDNTGADEYQTPIGGAIQTGFPKGVALNTWLGVVNALTVGQLPIAVGRHNALVGAANTPSTAWIQSGALATPASTQYFSFDMPFNAPLDDAGEPEVCGRVVYSDLHVGAEETDYASGALVTPTGCVSGELSPDEKALEFMLFDLSSCVTPIGSTPQPPPTTGPTPK